VLLALLNTAVQCSVTSGSFPLSTGSLLRADLGKSSTHPVTTLSSTEYSIPIYVLVANIIPSLQIFRVHCCLNSHVHKAWVLLFMELHETEHVQGIVSIASQ
jgi:hypothetical protein